MNRATTNRHVYKSGKLLLDDGTSSQAYDNYNRGELSQVGFLKKYWTDARKNGALYPPPDIIVYLVDAIGLLDTSHWMRPKVQRRYHGAKFDLEKQEIQVKNEIGEWEILPENFEVEYK